LNYELFIAKRIIATKAYKSTVSKPIIKIAIIAVALGLVMMLLSIAIAFGMQDRIREKVSAFSGHIIISAFDANNSEVTLKPIAKNQDFYPNFKNVNGIKKVQVYATKAGIIRTEKDFEGVILKGVDADYDWTLFKSYLIAGRLPKLDEKKKSKEMLVSQTIANHLGLKVGNRFNTFFFDDNGKSRARSFTLVGIYKTAFDEFDKAYIIGDIRQIQKLNHWNKNQVGGFEVLLDNFDTIDEKGEEIYAETFATLNTKTIKEKYADIFEWLKLFDTNVAMIIIIMIFVAGINMITALLVLILERTQMIGMLKAMGATNLSIRKIFIYNAVYIIVKGLLWGNAIGLALIAIQYYLKPLKLDPVTYYVDHVPISINFSTIFILNIGVLLLCLLILIVPSIVIAKISPVKAIKFE